MEEVGGGKSDSDFGWKMEVCWSGRWKIVRAEKGWGGIYGWYFLLWANGENGL